MWDLYREQDEAYLVDVVERMCFSESVAVGIIDDYITLERELRSGSDAAESKVPWLRQDAQRLGFTADMVAALRLKFHEVVFDSRMHRLIARRALRKLGVVSPMEQTNE